MNKEELIAFLKENLKVYFTIDKHHAVWGDGKWTTAKVEIYLGEEIVCSDQCNFP